MKAVSHNTRKGSRKYKLNYPHLLNYDNKTGFYKSYEQQTNTNHWKCEKCDNVFMTLRDLKQHKEEHHSY
jgi:hypothetical protein